MSLQDSLIFEPLAMERVWGGRRLEAVFGKRLPQGAPIGELWELVDREDAQSVVHQGELKGQTLNDLWKNKRAEVFGQDYVGSDAPRFPILIKLLDARERLSVQVHPPVHMAAALNGEPKTEMWYFADALPGATIYAGLKHGVTRDRFETLLREGHVAEALHVVPVSTGDSIFIPSGRLHAIGEGNVIVEVQQNSDTTYRVFDWNRVGLDGSPRKLHIEESMVSTDFADFEPGVQHVEQGTVAECPYFKVEKVNFDGRIPAIANDRFAVYTVLEGKVTVGSRSFVPGEFFLVPASFASATLAPVDGQATVLRTTLPV